MKRLKPKLGRQDYGLFPFSGVIFSTYFTKCTKFGCIDPSCGIKKQQTAPTFPTYRRLSEGRGHVRRSSKAHSFTRPETRPYLSERLYDNDASTRWKAVVGVIIGDLLGHTWARRQPTSRDYYSQRVISNVSGASGGHPRTGPSFVIEGVGVQGILMDFEGNFTCYRVSVRR